MNKTMKELNSWSNIRLKRYIINLEERVLELEKDLDEERKVKNK